MIFNRVLIDEKSFTLGVTHGIFHEKNRNFWRIWLHHYSAVERMTELRVFIGNGWLKEERETMEDNGRESQSQIKPHLKGEELLAPLSQSRR